MVKSTGKGGSFGIPEDMMEAINESKAKARGEKYEPKKEANVYDSESIPEVEETGDEGKEAEPTETQISPEEEIALQMKDAKKSLGIDITEDDMWSLFMGNQLTKEEIVIVPGKLVATMKTLSLDETQEIDQKMAEALEMKFLETGFMNLKTKHLLAAGLMELGKPGKARQIGKTHEERLTALGKMSTVLIERIAHKWNQFTWLVNETVNQEMDSGKS